MGRGARGAHRRAALQLDLPDAAATLAIPCVHEAALGCEVRAAPGPLLEKPRGG
jgi:hypothetical protein